MSIKAPNRSWPNGSSDLKPNAVSRMSWTKSSVIRS
jgi:hypothetical protein